MRARMTLIALLLMLVPITAQTQISAVPPQMNFQGRLARPDGTPIADGIYSVRFSLWNAASGGTETWGQTLANVTVKNGTFAASLTGLPTAAFSANLWLEIQIGNEPPLTPRQAVSTVAYAFKADSVKDGAITSASIANGTIMAADLAPNVLNPLAWLLGGNAGVVTGFLGTTDNYPLVFKVNNRRGLQVQYAQNTTGTDYRSINILGGSQVNTIGANVVGATIAGGGQDFFSGTDFPNSVGADFGTVGGGFGNTAGSYATTISGGQGNTAGEQFATVGGGLNNTASGDSTGLATVGGGGNNTADGRYATIGGGDTNIASGRYATVPGGRFNAAMGTGSFAAGQSAKANHAGSFVWADNSSGEFASNVSNQFSVRATGGIRLYTGTNPNVGVTLSAGDSSWNVVSDRNAKINFQNPDPTEILERLVAIPISTWNYKTNTDIRHIGPMAQDFYTAFGGLGADDTHISTVDADGVALAAIQGLHRLFTQQQKQLRELQLRAERAEALAAENAELKARNTAIETQLTTLAAAIAELKAERSRARD